MVTIGSGIVFGDKFKTESPNSEQVGTGLLFVAATVGFWALTSFDLAHYLQHLQQSKTSQNGSVGIPDDVERGEVGTPDDIERREVGTPDDIEVGEASQPNLKTKKYKI